MLSRHCRCCVSTWPPLTSCSMLRQPAAELVLVGSAAIRASSAETIAGCGELRYSSDAEPGIARRRAGSGFYYVMPNGRRVTDAATLERVRKLAIPPAYRDVWI